MILSTDEIKQIASGKRRMIRVPRRSNKPPWQPDRPYKIKAKDGPTYTVTCTSTEPATFQNKPVWVLRFERGDLSDTPRLLAAKWSPTSGDYVTSPTRGMQSADEEVSATTQTKYATEARTGASIARNALYTEQIGRMRAAISVIREYAPDPRISDALRGVERQVASLERKTA